MSIFAENFITTFYSTERYCCVVGIRESIFDRINCTIGNSDIITEYGEHPIYFANNFENDLLRIRGLKNNKEFWKIN